MTAPIGNAFRAILTADADVTTALGSRIYPQMARQGVSQPYAVYNVVAELQVQSLSAHSELARATVQLDVFDDDYADAHDAAEKCRLALQDTTGTYATVVVQDVFSEGGLQDDIGTLPDGTEVKVHRVSRDFVLWYRQDKPT